MKILSVSDVELESIYCPNIAQRYGDVDLVIGCGDLSYYYLEYIISSLDVPLYFVRGNHNHLLEISVAGTRTYPWGAVDLHRRSCRDDSGLLLAGIEGSLRYRQGPYQYSEPEMWLLVLELAVSLMWNRLIYGRFLDVLVTHAPPWKVHDQEDRPHRGSKAFRWLIKVFQPSCHFHGHVHVQYPHTVTETVVGNTRVVNSYGRRVFEIEAPQIATTCSRKKRV